MDCRNDHECTCVGIDEDDVEHELFPFILFPSEVVGYVRCHVY